MINIIIFLLGAYVGGNFAFYFIYSPKAQIKQQWKAIQRLGGAKIDFKEDSVASYIVNSPYDEAILKRKKVINSLLDIYFDPGKDEDYIKQNRP